MKMNLLLLVCIGLFAGCDSVPANRKFAHQGIDTSDLRRASYNDFVKRRTLELERIGGPYKNDGTAAQQAGQEAQDRFGEIHAGSAQTVTATEARKAKAQAAFNDQLQKMQRRQGD